MLSVDSTLCFLRNLQKARSVSEDEENRHFVNLCSEDFVLLIPLDSGDKQCQLQSVWSKP